MPTINAATETAIRIRDIETAAEMRRVEDLQKEVWGIPDLEVVPLAQLVAAKTAGGVLVGAFEANDLVGFAYGFGAHERGQAAHHSHMLAVKPEYRSHHLGYRLKLAQRERVLAQGIKLMSWTFDPLQSLNAYFNFNKLGVLADSYFVNFYGDDAASFLHQNGTDRLWVTWLLASSRVDEKLAGASSAPDYGKTELLVEVGEDGAPRFYELKKESLPEHFAIEIPADISRLEKQSREPAIEWREATRRAFTEAFAAGYFVENFHRQSCDGRNFGLYLLSRGKRFEDFK